MTKNEYVDFLIHTPVNFTGTALADHVEGVSHDSVQNKQYSQKIGLVKLQYSGAAHGLVKGIGVVNLVHSDGNEYHPIDYRIYAPDQDGKTKKMIIFRIC